MNSATIPPQKLAYYYKMIEDYLPELLPDGTPDSLRAAIADSLLGGGKRIRGILTLAFYEYCGGENPQKALPFAAAVEMIHAYSLVHDDLPCMDNDDMRRGKPSCHIAYGESTALLAGDALLTLAFDVMSAEVNASTFGAERVLAAANALAKAAGAGGMIAGQVMDLANENAKATTERLMHTDEKKTGALIKVSAEIGCILAGADESKQQAARQYAADIGLAFQIVDDILDVAGDADKLGKPTGSDAKNAKSTYISLYGIEHAKQLAHDLTENAANTLKNAGGDSGFLVELANYLNNRTS